MNIVLYSFPITTASHLLYTEVPVSAIGAETFHPNCLQSVNISSPLSLLRCKACVRESESEKILVGLGSGSVAS